MFNNCFAGIMGSYMLNFFAILKMLITYVALCKPALLGFCVLTFSSFAVLQSESFNNSFQLDWFDFGRL